MIAERDKLYERIVQWNKDRGLMALDTKLETKMLLEELGEVLTATSPAHRLQEACDFLFVFAGTYVKYEALEVTSDHLERWKETVNVMFSDVWDVIVDLLKEDGTEQLIGPALELVCDANDWKPKVKVNGKIIKGGFYVSPLEAIEELVDASKDH